MSSKIGCTWQLKGTSKQEDGEFTLTYVNLDHKNHTPGDDDNAAPNHVMGLQAPLAPQAQLFEAARQDPLLFADTEYGVDIGPTSGGYNAGISSVSVFTQTDVSIIITIIIFIF